MRGPVCPRARREGPGSVRPSYRDDTRAWAVPLHRGGVWRSPRPGCRASTPATVSRGGELTTSNTRNTPSTHLRSTDAVSPWSRTLPTYRGGSPWTDPPPRSSPVSTNPSCRYGERKRESWLLFCVAAGIRVYHVLLALVLYGELGHH